MTEPLVTGSPLGTINAQEEIYLDSAPYLYFQEAEAPPLWNPDGDGFYWNLSGTATYPVFRIGCVQDVSLSEMITMNAVRCDSTGDKDAVQRRDALEMSFNFTSLFPFSASRHMLKLGSAPTVTTGYEKQGIGSINNNKFYHFWAPKVYDDDYGDFVGIHFHRAKFVDPFTLAMRSGEPWQASGIKIRAFADETKPSAQKFGSWIRFDPSALP